MSRDYVPEEYLSGKEDGLLLIKQRIQRHLENHLEALHRGYPRRSERDAAIQKFRVMERIKLYEEILRAIEYERGKLGDEPTRKMITPRPFQKKGHE